MRKLKNIFISGILSVCMIVTSLPTTLLAQEVEMVQEDNGNDIQENIQEDTHDKVQYELISFAELPESVKNQSVALGTDIEELELPETLTASYRSFKEKPEDNTGNEGGEKEPGVNTGDEDDEKDPEENSGDEDGEKDSEDNTGNKDDEKDPEENSGDEGSETDSEDNTGDEGDEKDPEENSGNEGGEKDSEDNTGNIDDEKNPEENSVDEGGEKTTEENPGDESKAEQAVKEETFEVHIKEYNAWPEDMDAPKTLVSEDSDSGLSEETKLEYNTETIVIGNVTWVSSPAYDGGVEGVYIFTPVIAGNYIIAEGAALPEIIVTVGEAEEADLSEEAEEPLMDVDTEPAVGVISTNTTWTAGTLTNGTVIVKEGVTLTITGVVIISGEVIIEGGGSIERENLNAYFNISTGGKLTVGNIIIDGKSLSASMAMIRANDNTELTLDHGCIIQNCINGGAIICMNGARSRITMNNATIKNCSASIGGAINASSANAEIIINDGATIESCSAVAFGGAIAVQYGTTHVIINGGTFKSNYTTRAGDGISGGGAIFICSATLTVNGGTFIENTTPAKGGAIHHCGHSNTKTFIYGGYFEGNTCSNSKYKGSGGVYNSTQVTGSTDMTISGSVQFCGDGIEASGTDGIFLDQKETTARKIWINNALSYPITIYADASEGYVIATGDGYVLLKNRDMKKIKFYDTKGKMWYPCLDKEKNHIYVSENPPFEDVFFVYYISNGAEGQVEDNNNDDNGYESGATTTVQSADGLRWEEHEFVEWNTQADGNGISYHPGDTLKITGDIDLYAIFKETQGLAGTFYSGGANRKEIKSANLVEGNDTVTITTPELKDMENWNKLGWNTDKDGYTGDIEAGTALKISDNTSYYGIYERNVTLSYDANGANADNNAPPDETGKCLANVHEEITYYTDGFVVSGDITADNTDWEFAGWNTEPDGTGDLYREGDIIKISEDTTLYATFETPPYAYFYSGNAGEYELKKTNVVTKKIITPSLEEKSGWEEIGWNEDSTGYEGRIKQGIVIELENNTSYYGIYKKEVTLSYSILHNEFGSTVVPSGSTKSRLANVHEEAITYSDSISGDPESFEFDIAPDISYAGYEFIGWNTKEDGTGTFYRAGDAGKNKISITQDTTLYAILMVAPVAAFYSGEAGRHETIKGEFNYSVNATVTAPDLEEMDGWEPLGWSTDETGYSVNNTVDSVISLTKNTSFYGIYKKQVELTYDANDWAADKPDTQRVFRYAKVYNDITYAPVSFTAAPAITRAGYSFVGWSNSRNVDESSHIYGPDESIELEDSVTLYAQMIDDIAPVLGEASYNSGYKDIEDWIVRKKDLVITVPITEEGSGVNKIVYTLTPENGETVTGEVLMEEAYVPRQVRQAAVVQLDVVGGKVNVNSQDTMADEQSGTTGGQVGVTDGQIQARITISEDYKGTVSLKCLDNAGNESADKLLTATGGGVIVEDNAPQISFINKNIKNSKATITVSVSDDVDTDKNNKITGGIASITYQVDNKQKQNVTDKNFAEEIVPDCEFNVDISGSGEHTLKVTAVDNAGNESQQSSKVIIAAKNKKATVIESPPTEDKKEFVPLVKVNKPELPKDSEPATGDSSMRVEVYATIAMIAGLLYVLLYFVTGPNGMTEEDKNETVSHILNWAKKGGSCRKFIAIAAIFCVLFYYHSIGKRVNVEWKEVVGS